MWKKFVNEELYQHITTTVFEMYKLNGKSHNEEHVKNVLKRALEISEGYNDIDKNILFTAVSYHDIGDHIDRETHEIISANMMMEDNTLNKIFNKEEKIIIKEAIEDHRASKGKVPRSIYGKILASADKNVDLNIYFIRTCEYGIEHYKNYTEQQQLDRIYEHAIQKFGKNGYAVDKYYVQDNQYENF